MGVTHFRLTLDRLLIGGCAGLFAVAIGTPMVLAQAEANQRSPSRTESFTQVPTDRRPTTTAQETAPTLSPRSSPDAADRRLAPREEASTTGPTRGSTKGLWPVTGSLALVLGVLAAFLWIGRRAGWTHSPTLPNQAIQVLGSTPLDARHQLRLVRIGHRVVALAVSATTVQLVADIGEPEEVARLTSLCNNGHPTLEAT